MMRRGLLKEYSSVLNAVQHTLDWAGIIIAAYVAHRIYLDTWSLSNAYRVVIGIVVLLAALLFPRFSLYQTWRGASLANEIKAVTLAWTMVLFLLLAFAFTTKMGIQFSRGWIGLWSLLGWFFLIFARLLLRGGLRWLRSHGYNQRSIVIVGGQGIGEELSRRLLASPWIGLQVVGFFNAGPGTPQPGVSVLGGLRDVANYVTNERIDQVWIALPLKDEDKVAELLHELRHSLVDIRFVPDIFGFRLLNHSVTEVAGFPVMNLSSTPMVGMNRLVKAFEDRLLALLILLLISPLMVLLAIGVRLSSPGPIFYRQERVGWNGRTFNMLKFRSMPVDTDKDGVRWGNSGQKVNTKFGAFIRRTSLDELPQFINVLLGEMSIVGPRPERTIFVEKFKDEIPDYMKKHMVKAGITGWAQVNGWRGDTDLNKRIEYDLYYIEHWSLWFDLRIILLTLFKGFINKNAY